MTQGRPQRIIPSTVSLAQFPASTYVGVQVSACDSGSESKHRIISNNVLDQNPFSARILQSPERV